MPRNLFWNVVGTAGLGFCSFVLTLNLSFFPWIVAGELAQGYHVQALLSNDYLTPYGFFNIVASGVACFLIIKRATARNVMGYPQIAIVVVAASVLVLWSRLAYGDRPLRWEERVAWGVPGHPCGLASAQGRRAVSRPPTSNG